MKEKIRYFFHGNSQLFASIIAAILLMAPVVWMILSAVNHSRNLKAFVYELSLATIYAAENDTLKATQNNDEIRVEYHNALPFSLSSPRNGQSPGGRFRKVLPS